MQMRWRWPPRELGGKPVQRAFGEPDLVEQLGDSSLDLAPRYEPMNDQDFADGVAHGEARVQ